MNERCLPTHSLGDTLSRILSLGLEVGLERKGSIGGPTNRGWGARGGIGIGAEWGAGKGTEWGTGRGAGTGRSSEGYSDEPGGNNRGFLSYPSFPEFIYEYDLSGFAMMGFEML